MTAVQSAFSSSSSSSSGSSNSTNRRDHGPGPGPGPSSPTLTNPDMILPDYDYAAAASLDGRSHSPRAMWHSACDDDLASFQPMPLTPMTPIIYGNGTMLSDIGEVTEVESTPGCRPRGLSSRQSGTGGSDGTPLRSSPTVGNKVTKKRMTHAAKSNPERRLSIDSTSTLNEPERATPFDDFDDSVSVDDSNFQGDDEESMASSYMEVTSVDETAGASMPSAQGSMSKNRYSTTSISKRAEQILANAKRRLNTMEGNLSMARSFSYSSVSDGSTPSPVAQTRTATTALADAMLPHSPSSHTRNVSETGVRGAAAAPSDHAKRSASALGAAGGYRQPLPLSRSADGFGGRYCHVAHKISHYPLDTTLATLSEDDDGNHVFDGHPDASSISCVTSPTSSSYSDAGLSRSTSVTQVRNLQDQMEDLKGKISSLKEQARADSMRRRSMQSLRTMSPFTHAQWEQGYTEQRSVVTPDQGSPALASPRSGTAPEDEASRRPNSPERGNARALPPEHDERSAAGGQGGAREIRVDVLQEPVVEAVEESLAQSEKSVHGAHLDVVRAENGHVDDVDGDDDADNVDNGSESGESLYHDTYQHAVSHEDREDAFDYEHFFLHSAMGTLSRQGVDRRDSSGSEESDDSAETTRGPVMSRVRRPSIDTFTTVDSFATAIEGRVSRSSASQGGGSGDGFVTPCQEMYDEAAVGRLSSIFGGSDSGSGSGGGSGGGSDETDDLQPRRWRQGSVLHRPKFTSTSPRLYKRPSISSFESTGTNRSFPLVNKVRLSGGILTPVASPEHHDLRQVSESLMAETASICDRESVSSGGPLSPAMQTLSREDQMTVERVVASLGKCVLGLTEASRTNPGAQAELRRRIDAARRMLEGGK